MSGSIPIGPINGLLTAGTLTSSELTGPLAHKTIDILVNMIRNGDAYVNVDTTQNQNGQVRGQIYIICNSSLFCGQNQQL